MRQLAFSASEASEGMQYLAMAGWDTNEIIAAMPGLLDLAAAGATDLGAAADIVSDVMTAMGMEANEASRAADVFAKAATSSNTTVEMLGETMKYAAPIAHTFGMSLEEVSALAGMMANAGIKGSQAGTAPSCFSAAYVEAHDGHAEDHDRAGHFLYGCKRKHEENRRHRANARKVVHGPV